MDSSSDQPGTRPVAPDHSEELLVEVDATTGVAVVTLHRPERRNALSSSLIKAIQSVMTDLDGRPDVGCIVLTGADPAFCAGLDLRELGTAGNQLGRTVLSQPTSRGPWAPLATVVIGAVNGPSITGGLEIALACDFLVGSERAVFADTHARLGIQPTWGLSVRLPEAVGLRRAREMSATGRFVDASTALEWGLLNRVVPHESLLDIAMSLAADVAAGDRPAIARMMATYRDGALVSGAEAWRVEWEGSISFQNGGIDASKVAERRAEVISRGRAQL